MLEISGVESGRVELTFEPISVGEIVAESWSLSSPLANQREITFECGTIDGHVVMAEARRLKQVLINLLSNGIKYNRFGGRLRVTCERCEHGRVRIDIGDTGKGIAPDDLEKLCTPFERLDAPYTEIEGTGLGLVIARTFIHAMTGSLSVTSELNVGSIFSIEMPGGSPREDEVGAEAQSEKSEFAVLSIEDHASNLNLLEAAMRRRGGLRLNSATSGNAGIRFALLTVRRPEDRAAHHPSPGSSI